MQTHEVVLLQFYALQHIRKAALADIHFFQKNYFIRAMTYLLKSNELNFLHGVKGSLGVMKNKIILSKCQSGHHLLMSLLKID